MVAMTLWGEQLGNKGPPPQGGGQVSVGDEGNTAVFWGRRRGCHGIPFTLTGGSVFNSGKGITPRLKYPL